MAAALNPYGAPGSVGDSVTWPWVEVEAHPMSWIAAFTRASRDFSAVLQPFVHVEDHGILDPDDE